MRTNSLFAAMPATIFDVMSGLARQHGAINLGQGFPDTQGPEALRRRAGEALMAGTNQYPPMRGVPALREAAAAHFATHQGLSLTADNVIVTSGATEALAASLLALISDGDEVIVLDPAYDAYRPLIARAGGVARSVALQPPDWRLSLDAIEAAITPRTRVVMFNAPMNPCARVFDDAEMAALAALCVRHDLIAICDEVWEHVVFDGRAHRAMLSLPGMAERAVKISSAGKIFSMTGWKVGMIMAAPALIEPIAKAHQYLTFTTPAHLQEAVAEGLNWGDAYFAAMRNDFQRSRDRLSGLLQASGFSVLPSHGTYFICVDLKASGIAMDAHAFCLRAVQEFGIAAIPLSPFYADADAAPSVIRLCFAKSDATLDEGAARLARAKEAMHG